MESNQKRQKTYIFLLQSFFNNFGDFLRETGLHGLKFVGDSALSLWER